MQAYDRPMSRLRRGGGVATGACVVLLGAASTSGAATRWFHSPSGNIQCEVRSAGSAYCQTGSPARSVTLRRDGTLRTCRGTRCLGDGPENAFTLRYGRSVRVGPYRCTSLQSGMRCVVVSSGRGFLLNRAGVHRV